MSATPVNDFAVPATLTVKTDSAATAASTAATALGDINTALTTLANGTEFSVPEIDGQIQFDYGDEVDGGFYVEGQLLCPSTTQAGAQSAAEAAQAAINTAIASITPAVTVTLESTPDGFVFELLQ